mgnify:CR=1 FL=1
MRSLLKELRDNVEASRWWNEFRTHTIKVSSNYRGREDIEKFRDIFNDGLRIFKDYDEKVQQIIDQMNLVVNNISNDECICKLRESLSTLSDDLFWRDKDGNR